MAVQDDVPNLVPPGGGRPHSGDARSSVRPLWFWVLTGILVALALGVVLWLPSMTGTPLGLDGNGVPEHPLDPVSLSTGSPADDSTSPPLQQQTADPGRGSEPGSGGVALIPEVSIRSPGNDRLEGEESTDANIPSRGNDSLEGEESTNANIPSSSNDRLEGERNTGVDGPAASAPAAVVSPVEQDQGPAAGEEQVGPVSPELPDTVSGAETGLPLEPATAGSSADTEPEQETVVQGSVTPPKDEQARAEEAAAEQAFSLAMTRFLEQLEAGNTRAAGETLGMARKAKPGAPGLQDAARRLNALGREKSLQRLAYQGRRAEKRGDWKQAEDIYARALKIESNASFARDGVRRARERQDLESRLDRYLKAPQRLQADQPRKNAGLLLKHLQRLPDPGTKLAEGQKKLADLLAAWDQPVTLRISSDDLTEVVINRVGRLGRFQQREVALRPGSYTLVGYRDGYRDIRLKVTIQPGTDMQAVVRCEERI
ncbi:MAG: hypothetical protein GY703_00950 [Gammaproteobacteria bacterium]|nr:hypothetical protein [Gammaproteobacteria bacterium]